MIVTGTAGNLLVPFKATFFVALFLAMPVVLFQIWAFVAPGLYKKEKRFAMPLLASSIVLFYLGIAFAYFVVFPLMFGFFTAIAPEGVEVVAADQIAREINLIGLDSERAREDLERTQLYPEYKSTREKAPDELLLQDLGFGCP